MNATDKSTWSYRDWADHYRRQRDALLTPAKRVVTQQQSRWQKAEALRDLAAAIEKVEAEQEDTIRLALGTKGDAA